MKTACLHASLMSVYKCVYASKRERERERGFTQTSGNLFRTRFGMHTELCKNHQQLSRQTGKLHLRVGLKDRVVYCKCPLYQGGKSGSCSIMSGILIAFPGKKR